MTPTALIAGCGRERGPAFRPYAERLALPVNLSAA